VRVDLHSAAEARTRILQLLAETPDGATLDQLLPPPDRSEDEEWRILRQRSVWASTFSASLELAKHGEVALEQRGEFQPIHIGRVCV
jgi:chromatin segregation and condensation protein Rec8/ScpA/Scc1 (kleisin family)